VHSSLSCSPLVAGSVTNLELSFLSDTFVAQGESITISLPGFERRVGSGILNISGSARTYFSNFYDNCSALLFLTALQDVVAFKNILILIPESEGVSSPASGISSSDPRFTLKTNAADIKSSATSSIRTVFPIGSFDQERLALRFLSTSSEIKAEAGEACEITFNLTTSMSISRGEAMRLRLPGFALVHANTRTILSLSAPRGALMDAIWSDSEYQLLIPFTSDIQAHTEISGKVLGLAIPEFGIQASNSSIAISINASAGPIDWTLVRKLDAVGAFLRESKISFQPSMANSPTSINITLYPSMQIAQSSRLILHLPFFFASELSTSRDFSSNMAGLAIYTWNESSSELTIVLNADIPAFHATTLTVASDSGIRIPQNGLRANETFFLLSTDALDGPVKASRIYCLSPIGGKT
jgi:hypothetical protein